LLGQLWGPEAPAAKEGKQKMARRKEEDKKRTAGGQEEDSKGTTSKLV